LENGARRIAESNEGHLFLKTRFAGKLVFTLRDSSKHKTIHEKMLPMLTAYMGNVREKGLLRYFELTPSRYRAQLACLDVRTRAPDVAIRPANSDRECRKELQNSNGRNRALRVGADLPSEFL
jgi:hypothetical protein